MTTNFGNNKTRNGQSTDVQPRWVEQLDRCLPIKTQIVLHGNIYDHVPSLFDEGPTGWSVTFLVLRKFLHGYFKSKGYAIVGFYDLVDGLTFEETEESNLFNEIIKGSEGEGHESTASDTNTHIVDLAPALDAVRRAVSNRQHSTAIVLDFASRFLSNPTTLRQDERSNFIRLIKCARDAAHLYVEGNPINNLTILICDKTNDLPPWLYLNNPQVSSIQIELPDEIERYNYFRAYLDKFHMESDSMPDGKGALSSLVGYTAGLRFYDLKSIRIMSNAQKMGVATDGDVRKLIDLYKFGKKDNPWEKIVDKKRDVIRSMSDELTKQVRGQEAAVGAVTDMLKRAIMGLSGTQHSLRSQKPRGVLFFAGPTGVGKTEMAKALAQFLFDDKDACIRFDMSEYSTSQSGEKLLGAPPGYVGYQEGGQLTNRVRQNPFCILLFDEIEKADPSILEKFLQILDDGRMTDGRGETTYFSESIIIFTSNLGTFVRSDDSFSQKREANIKPFSWVCDSEFCESKEYFLENPHTCPQCGSKSMKYEPTPYSVVRSKILEAIQFEFKERMGRPELYNRFGNNFVVFDYIRRPIIAEIVEMNLDRVIKDLAERKKIDVEFAPEVVKVLVEKTSDRLEMGARGVGNDIETMIVNPLARQLFDEGIDRNAGIFINSVIETKRNGFSTYSLDLKKR